MSHGPPINIVKLYLFINLAICCYLTWIRIIYIFGMTIQCLLSKLDACIRYLPRLEIQELFVTKDKNIGSLPTADFNH